MPHLSRLARAAAAAILLVALPAAAEPVTLTIAHVNDLDRMEEVDGRGGIARLAGALAELRRSAPNLIVTNGGDAISPSLMSGFDKGAHIIDLFNHLGFDAMALGNHEFDFGPEVLVQRIGEAWFPILAANAKEPGGSPVKGAKPHILLRRGGFTLGVFGLTTPETPMRSSPGPVTFGDPVATAREEADALRRDGADLVVALAHTSLEEDADLIRSRTADLILSGHDHVLRVDYDGRTAMVEAASQADYVMVVELTLDRVKDRTGKEKVVWHPSFRTLDTAGVAPDPAMAERIAVYQKRLSGELDKPVATLGAELDSRRTAVRGGEAAIGNLIADAMRSATGADVALMNGGGIRADRTYPAGSTLTRRDIQAELPFGNRVVTLEVTGAVLRAAFEHAVARAETGDGRFPQIAGAALAYDGKAPAGQRLRTLTVGGAPVEDGRTYVLATNDFVARGGDGYTMLTAAPRRIDEKAGRLLASVVIDHLETAKSYLPKVEGRVVSAP